MPVSRTVDESQPDDTRLIEEICARLKQGAKLKPAAALRLIAGLPADDAGHPSFEPKRARLPAEPPAKGFDQMALLRRANDWERYEAENRRLATEAAGLLAKYQQTALYARREALKLAERRLDEEDDASARTLREWFAWGADRGIEIPWLTHPKVKQALESFSEPAPAPQEDGAPAYPKQVAGGHASTASKRAAAEKAVREQAGAWKKRPDMYVDREAFIISLRRHKIDKGRVSLEVLQSIVSNVLDDLGMNGPQFE